MNSTLDVVDPIVMVMVILSAPHAGQELCRSVSEFAGEGAHPVCAHCWMEMRLHHIEPSATDRSMREVFVCDRCGFLKSEPPSFVRR